VGSGCIDPRILDLGTSWRLVARHNVMVKMELKGEAYYYDLLIMLTVTSFDMGRHFIFATNDPLRLSELQTNLQVGN
jgi:hypothetical protein